MPHHGAVCSFHHVTAPIQQPNLFNAGAVDIARPAPSMRACAGILASGGDDGSIAVWNLTAQTGGGSVLNTVVNQERDKGLHIPHHLLFQHLGHRAQVACVLGLVSAAAAAAAAGLHQASSGNA